MVMTFAHITAGESGFSLGLFLLGVIVGAIVPAYVLLRYRQGQR